MSFFQPFMPAYGSGVNVTIAAAGSGTVAIARHNKQCRIVNTGSGLMYIRTYNSTDGAQTATAADYAIPGGSGTTITKDMSHNSLAYFSTPGTTFSVIAGEGF